MNPIKYSDLVQPDNSIQNLIEQLTALIAKYEEARSKIQGAAQEAARSMQNLSGATEEQRQEISGLAAASEKLLNEYKKASDAEREAYRTKQASIQAEKEQQRIDKLIVEINKSKEGSYNRLSAQYRLNKIRLNEMSAEERKTTEYGKKLEKETRLMYEEMSRLQQATGKYTLEVGHYQNALKGLPGPIGQIVSSTSQMRTQLSSISNSSLPLASKAVQGFGTVLSGTVGLIMIFVRALTGSAKTLRDFEQANVNLSTILGVTVEEMQVLTNSALALGRATSFTASQVTQLQTELAKMGFSQGAILKMQKPILDFAVAMGTDLASAAQVAASTLRSFNLSSDQTERVLSVLTVATNKSALSFSKIQQSIGTVFPVANAFGVTVEDTAALLGSLANAGFEASNAATATRNILLNLSNANGKLAQSIGRPVKSLDEMLDAFIELRKSGLDLSEALELTDKRSVSAFAAFLSGAESAKELRDQLKDVSGILADIAEQRLQTISGQTDILKSAWDGLVLSFQNSNGTIRETITWLTKLINTLNQLLFPNQVAQQGIAERWTEVFSEYFTGDNANEAIAKINEAVKTTAKNAEEAWANVSPFQRWLGVGKDLKGATDKYNLAEGMKQAAAAAISDINQQTKEAADRAAREAETAQERAKVESEKAARERKQREEQEKRQRIADKKAVVEAINLEIAVTEAGTEKMLKLREDKINAERQVELEQNRQKTETERQDEAAINAKYDKLILEDKKKFNNEVSKATVQRLQAEQQALQMQISIEQDGTEEMLALRLELIKKQRAIAIEQNKQTDEKLRQDEMIINAKYDREEERVKADFRTKMMKRDIDAARDTAQAEFDMMDKNERQKTIFRLQQERIRLQKILELNEVAAEKMTQAEVDAVKKQIEAIDDAVGKTGYNNLYEVFGLSVSDEQQSALNTAFESIKDSLGGIADAWLDAANAAVESADKQVEAAQKVLDEQIALKEQGYANSVEQARKELDLAKKNQQAALAEQAKAQRAQMSLDTLSQTSSLITASANLWASFSKAGMLGPALAIAAIATMWGSFAAAKIKAAQVSSEKYGEGTVELLQGGSHASGHDIDLGTKPDGTRRRAEGGEYFAIINRRNSRRYRGVIPDVINSLNNGTFEARYRRAGDKMEGYAVQMLNGGSTDVSTIEKEVSEIRRQGEERRYTDAAGNTVVRYKNLTQKIKS